MVALVLSVSEVMFDGG